MIYLDAHSSVDVAHPNKVTLHICELFAFFFFVKFSNYESAVGSVEYGDHGIHGMTG